MVYLQPKMQKSVVWRMLPGTTGYSNSSPMKDLDTEIWIGMKANETWSGNLQYDVTVSQQCDGILQHSQVTTDLNT